MFQAEIRRIEKLMYRVGMSYLQNSEDAADAVQEALIRAWEKRGSLRSDDQLKPWIMRILTNCCIDMLRKRRRRSFLPLDEGIATAEPPAQPSPVMEAVAMLKPELRLVVTLHYVDGYSVSELAGALGLPQGTIKTRLRAARKRLSHTLLVEWEEDV